MDREQVRNRIKRAVAEGRISAPDGEIRLRNVDSASSETELGLIVRDLDQLETVIGPTSAAAPVSSGPARRLWPALVAAALVLLLAGGAVAFFTNSGDEAPGAVTGLGDPVPIGEDPIGTEESPADQPTVEASPAAPAYSFTPTGIRTFLRTYEERFGTTRVVSATFYSDYVIVQVPVPGKARNRGWVYRPVSGFTDFGGVRANFPGAANLDLARLDVPRLFANVARAKRVLNVEEGKPSHVNIDYRPQFDPAPNVNIYVSNSFNESGYLATRLDGRVERAYPYGG